MKRLFAAALLAAMMLLVGMPAANAAGNAYGRWAGLLCDSTARNGVAYNAAGDTYWETRNYADRGSCVAAEGQSLQRGEWDPAEWGL